MLKILNILSLFSLTKLLISFFIYSACISLLVQFLILPVFLPQFHIGNGLLDGGDWTFYHKRAVELSSQIETFGWSIWQIRPQGFGMIGFSSAVYSLTGIYEPYVLIPFFSILHSLGAISIVLLIEKLGVGRGVSIISSIPFLVFPSSLLWVTQILKDIFTINGSLIIILALISIVSITQRDNINIFFKKLLILYILAIFGFILIWIVRPYFIQITLIFVIIFFLITNFFFIFQILKKKLSIFYLISILLTQIVLILSIINLPKLDKEEINENSLLAEIPSPVIDESKIAINKIDFESNINKTNDNFIKSEINNTNNTNKTNNTNNTNNNNIKTNDNFIKTEINNNKNNTNKANDNFFKTEINNNTNKNNDECCIDSKIEKKKIITFNDWSYTPYLPTLFDNEFKKLYMQRIYFYSIQHSANSTFDIDIELNSFKKLVGYAPRAIQVGFLSPFPSSWFTEYPSQLSNLMHIISGFEMLFIYICLTGFAYSMFIWKKKLEFWMLICFSFYFTLIPTYAIPNTGSLIRYRYGALMLLVAIGISAFLKRYKRHLK